MNTIDNEHTFKCHKHSWCLLLSILFLLIVTIIVLLNHAHKNQTTPITRSQTNLLLFLLLFVSFEVEYWRLPWISGNHLSQPSSSPCQVKLMISGMIGSVMESGILPAFLYLSFLLFLFQIIRHVYVCQLKYYCLGKIFIEKISKIVFCCYKGHIHVLSPSLSLSSSDASLSLTICSA